MTKQPVLGRAAIVVALASLAFGGAACTKKNAKSTTPPATSEPAPVEATPDGNDSSPDGKGMSAPPDQKRPVSGDPCSGGENKRPR